MICFQIVAFPIRRGYNLFFRSAVASAGRDGPHRSRQRLFFSSYIVMHTFCFFFTKTLSCKKHSNMYTNHYTVLFYRSLKNETEKLQKKAHEESLTKGSAKSEQTRVTLRLLKKLQAQLREALQKDEQPELF